MQRELKWIQTYPQECEENEAQGREILTAPGGILKGRGSI